MKINETLYKTYVDAQKNNLDDPAIYTREGRMITHRELLDEIDKAAEGLLSFKKDTGFRIGILSASSYEEAVFLFAASKIGAASKFVDFSKNIIEINESITESTIDVLAMGVEFLPMEPFINPKALPVIVLGGVSAEQPHYCLYQDLIKKSVSLSSQPVGYKENFCSVLINSSGTTGAPKPIELSDRAINSAVEKMIKTDYPLSRKNLLLKIIPSHIGLGLITTLYTGLIIGVPVVYLGGNSAQESIELFIGLLNGYSSFLKNHGLPSVTKLLLFSAPMYYRALCQFADKLQDLSFIGCMLAAGSAMGKEELEIMDATFAEKGCTVPVLNGYGQNEMAGAVTLNLIGKNRRGSAGIVVNGTQLRIVDISTGTLKDTGTAGKILERSESLFEGYENMPERTASSFIPDENGNLWFDTTDVGYIDDDGFLFITGRSTRIIIRFDQKASLDKMESKIRMSKYVKEIGVISQRNIPYDAAIAFVVLKDEYAGKNISPEMIINEVQSGHNFLTDLEKIDKLLIVESLPYLSSGKIDYRTLEKEASQDL